METIGPRRPRLREDVIPLLRLNAGLVALCLAVSLVVTAALLWNCEPKAFARAMLAATILPLVLGVPILTYLAVTIVKLKTSVRQLERFAHRDALTQLLNRGAFTRLVEEKLDEMDGLATARGALLIADADHFKAINDRWGHAVGDHALREIGHAMSKVLQRDDLIGRLGGEEFSVFLYGSSPTSARTVAERLRAAVQAIDLRAGDGELVPLTISLGAAHFRQAMPFATLYNIADRKLYLAKANGRDRVEFEDVKVEPVGEMAA